MLALPRIYRTEKEFIEGLVYVVFSCECVYLDTEDRKRKKRSIFEVKENKRKNRIFCPNHKSDSYLKHRFKICPLCHTKIIVANNTVEGPCSKCSYFLKQEEYKNNTKIKKQKDCLQYGKEYQLKYKEKIISKPMCRNRSYCVSFIRKSTTLIQCGNCPYLNDNIFGD